MRCFFSCVLVCLASFVYAQDLTNGLEAYYSFDDCQNLNKEETGNNQAAVIVGEPSCVCGVSGNALNTFNKIDYTLSLYIKPTNAVGVQDIISKSESCGDDREFSVSYSSGANAVSVELSGQVTVDSIGKIALNSQLPFDPCWYHIVVLRRGRQNQLYVNGELVRERVIDSRIDFDNNAELNIANGECVGITRNRFSGLIDELRVYNRALRLEEIQALYLGPDKIENDDVLLFLGNSVDITVNETCANAFAWSPSTGVSDPSAAETTITPEAAGVFTYELDFSDQFCIANDTIQITVIDPEELPCAAQLPKAFTPNGDGRNDTYGISNSIVLDGKLVEFEIFDRWGGSIFSTTNPFDKWDGTFNGKELNPGVLLYRVRYMCGEEEKTDMGSLTLLR